MFMRSAQSLVSMSHDSQMVVSRARLVDLEVISKNLDPSIFHTIEADRPGPTPHPDWSISRRVSRARPIFSARSRKMS